MRRPLSLVRAFAPAVAVIALMACRGGAHTPGGVQIPVLTPTQVAQRCVNDTYPADAPAFEADQFEYTTTGSGLQVLDVIVGTGENPTPEDTVNLRFSGFLPDGCIFTSSYVQQEPVPIDLTTAIAGFQEAVTGMRVGGQRRARIPANLAYGDQGYPGRVPPASTVIFYIELQGIVDTSAESSTSTPAVETPEAGTPGPDEVPPVELPTAAP